MDQDALVSAGILTVRRLVVVTIVGLGLFVSLVGGDLWALSFFTPYAVTGALLAIRRPENTIGPLLVGIGWAFIPAILSVRGDPAALANGTAPLADLLVAWGNSWGWHAVITLLFVLTLVFPSGRLPSRHRRLALVAVVSAAASVILVGLAPSMLVSTAQGPAIAMRNPLALLPEAASWPSGAALQVLEMALLFVGVALVLARHRASHGVEHLQLRMFVLTLAIVGVGTPIGFAITSMMGMANADPRTAGLVFLAWGPSLVGLIAIPVAIAMAVLRHRLYEIDHLVSRTVTFTGVALVVATVYAVPVITMPRLLGQTSDVVVAGSTLAAAAVFNPLRRRIQHVVDRRFNRARFDAERQLDLFATGIRSATDLGSIQERLHGVVASTLAPERASMWIR